MIAIILARANSQRIPHKNIYPFLGKPLIAHVIQTALQSKLFDQVVVSTDGVEIARIAREYGASTPFLRPAHLADALTPSLEAIAHAIATLKLTPKTLVCALYGTSVLLQANQLQEAKNALLEHPTYKYAIALSPYGASPYRAFSLNPNPVPLFAEHLPKRTQDLPPLYHDTGLFYMGEARHFNNLEPLLAPHSYPIVVPEIYTQDIDTLEDLELAKLKYQLLHSHDHPSS
ncbi:pseudaminic acid cytidylyltransferase [Helicobacter felis]|uniref:pseudaminic acid cytidylyltransferase n=1 Tax=Helicobacter felis TaxID=214 RepID=UPI000CF0263E|nr:pseudaminic acid cytidylyltransferase [Helicobacter felis]